MIVDATCVLIACLSAGVGNDQEKVLKKFSIDSRTKTSFDVANHLWDLVGEGFEPIDIK